MMDVERENEPVVIRMGKQRCSQVFKRRISAQKNLVGELGSLIHVVNTLVRSLVSPLAAPLTCYY